MTLQERRKELETVIVNKAETDAEFRAAILADPKPILKKEFGLSFSDDCFVSVHQETPTHFHLVLPVHLQGELSDEALEAVAGGVSSQISIDSSLLHPPTPGGSNRVANLRDTTTNLIS